MTISYTNIIGCVALAALATFASPANADDSKKAKKEAAKPAAKTVETAGMTITADLIGNKQLTGNLLELTSLELQTNFGLANIPLSEVAGVHFASAENAWTTVVLINGDSITGTTNLSQLSIQTEWGTAKIHGTNVESMLFMPNLSWSSHTGLNGKRWILNKTTAGTAAKSKSLSPAMPASNNSILYPVAR